MVSVLKLGMLSPLPEKLIKDFAQGKDEIYVSSVVKELAAGKNYVFKPLGDFNLKGVNTPQTLYEVIWNTTEKPEEATDAKTRDAVPEQPVVETKLSQVLPEL